MHGTNSCPDTEKKKKKEKKKLNEWGWEAKERMEWRNLQSEQHRERKEISEGTSGRYMKILRKNR